MAAFLLPAVITIFFVLPLLITLLSVLFLGKRIGVHRILSGCMGLVGVLVIIRPRTADFQVEAVLVFGVALSYAPFQIWTCRLKSVGNLSAMVTVQQFCYIIGVLPILLVNYFMPPAASDNATLDVLFRAPVMPGMQDAGFFVICTAAVLFLSMASSNAYFSLEACMVAPFEYTAIPFAVIWGIAIWGGWPQIWSWVAIGLITSGGLYTIWRERARDGEVMTSTPMPASASATEATEEELQGED